MNENKIVPVKNMLTLCHRMTGNSLGLGCTADTSGSVSCFQELFSFVAHMICREVHYCLSTVLLSDIFKTHYFLHLLDGLCYYRNMLSRTSSSF